MISIMISDSVRNTVKPVTNVASLGLPTDWLRARGSHDVQSSLPDAHKQDEYPNATDPCWSLIKIISKIHLTEESIPVG